MILVSYPFHYLACFVILALGAFLFSITLNQDTVDDLNTANDDLKSLKSKLDIFKKLSESVRLNSTGKKLNATTNIIYPCLKKVVKSKQFWDVFNFSSHCFSTATWVNFEIKKKWFLKFKICFRLMGDFSQLYKTTIMVLFTACTLAICIVLLMIRVEIV